VLEISLSDGERSLLQELHQHHIHHVIRRRAHVLLLRAERIPNAKISHITGLGETTLIDYVHQYLKDGERWLTTVNFRKPVSQLQPFDEAIKLISIQCPRSHKPAKRCTGSQELL
jgi:hypothetical protein